MNYSGIKNLIRKKNVFEEKVVKFWKRILNVKVVLERLRDNRKLIKKGRKNSNFIRKI